MTQSSAVTYPWYAQVYEMDPLQQGDFVLKCQIIQPSVEAEKTGQNIKAIVKEYDVIVMSQSCDLISDKGNLALVCPYYLASFMTSFTLSKGLSCVTTSFTLGKIF